MTANERWPTIVGQRQKRESLAPVHEAAPSEQLLSEMVVDDGEVSNDKVEHSGDEGVTDRSRERATPIVPRED